MPDGDGACGDRGAPRRKHREVAEVAGVVDQGQISKLLGRLAALELIENDGHRQEKGAAKSWRLTERGAKVLQAANPRGVFA
jgi:chromosome segregation and condensation protein ScpB